MQEMEEGVKSPTSIEEIKDAIIKYENRVEDIMMAQEQVGVWYKMLASRYLEKQMYGEAYEAAIKSIEYYPANPTLYYSAAMSAGYIAKSKLGYDAGGMLSEKYEYLKTAESAYLRAIELDGRYARALYGLGVLYVFDLDQPEDAIPHLEKFRSINTKDTDGMMVLARAYYMTRQFERAADLYDLILETPTSPERKAEAAANKKIVLDASYGG
jgi:tetratricopeptide (TPR) repeat protein